MPDRTKKPYSRPTSTNGSWLHDRAPPTAPRAAIPSSKLLVSNLHYEITPKDLTAIFGQIGTLIREPHIRYDRSGRSSGVAIISFETQLEATRAKKQYDGILAKGQPMSIVFDNTPPPRTQRADATPTSLLHRIQKAPLLERLSQDVAVTKTPAGRRGVGPIRTRARAPRPVVKKPKTVEELDKEIDAFMGDGTDTTPQSAPAPATDVDM